MSLATISRAVLIALVTAAAPLAVGCVVEADAEADYPVSYQDDYHPEFYEGRVVYYDTAGTPYYYVNGRPYWVPRSYRHYDRYTYHYRTYAPRYQRWYHNGGYRHQGRRYRHR